MASWKGLSHLLVEKENLNVGKDWRALQKYLLYLGE
jgi:hypothetical protein